MKIFADKIFNRKFSFIKWISVLFFILITSFLVFKEGNIFKISFLTERGNKLVLLIILISVGFIVIECIFLYIKKLFVTLQTSLEKIEQVEYENKKIKEQMQQIKHLYEERDAEHKIILKMIMLILQSVELKKVLNVSLEILCNFLHYDRAIVYLYDRTKNVLECMSTYNVVPQELKIPPIDLNKQNNFITMTVTKRKPFIAGGIQDFNTMFQIFDAISHPDVIASVPLEAKDKIVGVLVVDNIKTKRRITQKDLRKLIEFTDIIGLAVENARLYETEKNFSEQLNIKLNEAVEQLKKAQQQAIRAETLAALGRMAAIISHEIRNMLTSIKNSAEVLSTNVKDESNKKYVEYILVETQHLNKVVDDILTVGQNIHLVPFPVDVNKFIGEIIETLNLSGIYEEGIQLVVELDKNLPIGFFDRDRIKQVIINIIQNAVYFLKSSIKKEIKIKTYLENGYIVISISDTGCGIPDDVKDKIFDPFFTTKPNGTGLGLTICRNIIAAHNGTISVESEVGKGTTFYIKLPLQKF